MEKQGVLLILGLNDFHIQYMDNERCQQSYFMQATARTHHLRIRYDDLLLLLSSKASGLRLYILTQSHVTNSKMVK